MVVPLRWRGAFATAAALATLLLLLLAAPASAHGGSTAGADNVSSVLVAADIGVISWFLHVRRRATGAMRTWKWALPPLAVLLLLGACTTTAWVPATTIRCSATKRPTTNARVQILAPTPNQAIAGTKTTLKLRLIGGRLEPVNTTKCRNNEGHMHVSVDNQLTSMTQGLEQPLVALTPGTHTVQAEFVAADHRPFQPRVIAFVLFRVTA